MSRSFGHFAKCLANNLRKSQANMKQAPIGTEELYSLYTRGQQKYFASKVKNVGFFDGKVVIIIGSQYSACCFSQAS
jgi:hypothetical protein